MKNYCKTIDINLSVYRNIVNIQDYRKDIRLTQKN